MNKKTVAGLVLLALLAGSNAIATPVVYSFSTGPITSAGGAGIGLLPSGTTATGTFTYDADAAFTSAGNGGFGRVYGGAMTNFTINVGAYTISDPYGFAFIGDEHYAVSDGMGGITVQNRDLIEFYAGPTGPGGWTTTDINGKPVARVRFYWVEGGAIGDFLSNENLPAALPSFLGGLALDIGPLIGTGSLPPASGIVNFGNFKATAVPEPQSGALFLAAMFGLFALTYRRAKA